MAPLQKEAEKPISPTPERIAKGDLLFGQDKVYRSMSPTIIDQWAVMERLGEVSDLVTITRRESFARLHNIAVGAGIPGIKAMDLSREIKHSPSLDEDLSLEEKTAKDEFKIIMKSLTDSRHRQILQQLCVDPNNEPAFSVELVLDALDALGEAFYSIDKLTP